MVDKKNYEIIDILKGIAIILVIIGHAVIYFPINLHNNIFCETLFQFVSIAHLPLFFLISGFLFKYKNSYKTYIKGKSLRIIIPYLIFSLIDLIPRILLPSVVNRTTNPIDGIVKMILYGGEYWFLYSLYLIYIFFPFLYKKIKNKYIYYFIIFLLVFIQFLKLPNVFLLGKTSYYLIYFILGFLLNNNEDLFKKRNLNIKNYTEIVIIMLMMIIYSFKPNFLNFVYNFLPLQIIFICIVIYFWYLVSEIIIKHKFKNLFIKCGKNSLILYLLNGYFLVISRYIFVNILHIRIPFIIIFFNTIIPIFGSLLLTKYIISRFKLLKFVFGMNTSHLK